MPNKLSALKVRISYAEDIDVRRGLERLAKRRGVALSDLVKEATVQYLARHAGEETAKPDETAAAPDVSATKPATVKYPAGRKQPKAS